MSNRFSYVYILILGFVLIGCNSVNDKQQTVETTSTPSDTIKTEIKEPIRLEPQLGALSDSMQLVINENLKLDGFRFWVNNDIVSPEKYNKVLQLEPFEIKEGSLMDTILSEALAQPYYHKLGYSDAYLSKDKKSALLWSRHNMKIVNADKGLIFEGDGSSFYEYDDTFNRFYLFNGGQSFIFYSYGFISFYNIRNGKIAKEDVIEVDNEYRANSWIDLSHDNDILYMVIYDINRKKSIVKFFDTRTQNLIFEKELASPHLIPSFIASPSSTTFVSFSGKDMLVFNEKLELVKAIKLKNYQGHRIGMFYEENGERILSYLDRDRLIIYDANKDSTDIIIAPKEYYFSSVCFDKNRILFGLVKYSQESSYKDVKIIESYRMEAAINDYKNLKFHEIELGYLYFEKFEDDLYMRIAQFREPAKLYKIK